MFIAFLITEMVTCINMFICLFRSMTSKLVSLCSLRLTDNCKPFLAQNQTSLVMFDSRNGFTLNCTRDSHWLAVLLSLLIADVIASFWYRFTAPCDWLTISSLSWLFSHSFSRLNEAISPARKTQKGKEMFISFFRIAPFPNTYVAISGEFDQVRTQVMLRVLASHSCALLDRGQVWLVEIQMVGYQLSSFLRTHHGPRRNWRKQVKYPD